ncbi:MAG: UTP--glucose-1-phosphate uridylyltransferase GalU [Clostridia bacterium]|nr:UTP--glucose-1-phosphate uridylyltransferase GalU [Clostridia bacterium]
MKIKKAIIPAAGLGSRFLPVTKTIPKEMLPIVNKPTIQYIVEEAVSSGIEEILIISGRNKTAILDHFDRHPYLENYLQKKGQTEAWEALVQTGELANIISVRQKEPKGLGHAVACAKSFVGSEPFAVLLGDDLIDSSTPCLKQLMDVFDEKKASILGIKSVPQNQVSKYGIINPKSQKDNLFELQDLLEKPQPEEAPSNLAIMGRYILTPAIFAILAETSPGVGGEIQLTDALKTLLQQEPVFGLAFTGKRYDVGNKLGYLQANLDFALQCPDIEADLRAYLQNII